MTLGQRQQLRFWLGALAVLLLLVYLLSPILLPFVAGSAIFGSGDYKQTIAAMRKAAG